MSICIDSERETGPASHMGALMSRDCIVAKPRPHADLPNYSLAAAHRGIPPVKEPCWVAQVTLLSFFPQQPKLCHKC
jgi:hypothetical protein